MIPDFQMAQFNFNGGKRMGDSQLWPPPVILKAIELRSTGRPRAGRPHISLAKLGGLAWAFAFQGLLGTGVSPTDVDLDLLGLGFSLFGQSDL